MKARILWKTRNSKRISQIGFRYVYREILFWKSPIYNIVERTNGRKRKLSLPLAASDEKEARKNAIKDRMERTRENTYDHDSNFWVFRREHMFAFLWILRLPFLTYLLGLPFCFSYFLFTCTGGPGRKPNNFHCSFNLVVFLVMWRTIISIKLFLDKLLNIWFWEVFNTGPGRVSDERARFELDRGQNSPHVHHGIGC